MLLQRTVAICALNLLWIMASNAALAEEFSLHRFTRQQLTSVYFSEGANAGDVNGDAIPDVVYGPHWYEGPAFEKRHEIYPPVAQDTNRYADNFFSWVFDFNADGWQDVLVVGFPGTPAYVYENPKGEGQSEHWPKHEVLDWVSNESPQFVNVVGDERPELVCTRDGYFGYAEVNWDEPFSSWQFVPVSLQVTAAKFGHGLGIGDVNGDGLADIIHSGGWYEQPKSKPKNGRWLKRDADFSVAYGGAEMYAYDVDGDGDNDIITSDAAHDFGLSWYEQKNDGGQIRFERHRIMGAHPSENKYGVVFSELHSVALVDMDGDGLKDIVTGKTYWSHHRQSPMWNAGAVVYWFKLVRSDSGVDWLPYQIDDDSGIGRQVSVVDLNDDGLPDVVLGGMKGSHVLMHSVDRVGELAWASAQPGLYTGPGLPSFENAVAMRGEKPAFPEGSHVIPGVIEGEDLEASVSGGSVGAQSMANFKSDRWSGDSQLFWSNPRPGDSLTAKFTVKETVGSIACVLTCARDYGVVQISIDGIPLGKPIDLYETSVVTTGVLQFEGLELKPGPHEFKVEMLGANPKADKRFMFGLDYLKLHPAD